MTNDTDSDGPVLPVSVDEVNMWGGDGTPAPTVTSAVCDVCGAWRRCALVPPCHDDPDGQGLLDVRVVALRDDRCLCVQLASAKRFPMRFVADSGLR